MKPLVSAMILAFWVIACAPKESNPEGLMGQDIFKKYCVLCHGIDGKLGLNGAKDITVSLLTEAERMALITKGKNTMTPFEGILTPEQILAVAAYTITLKSN